jgi:hypothetical protein
MSSLQDKFNFFVPARIEKSGESGELMIRGIASSLAVDSDGESLDPSGFDYTPLLETGFFNWNHQAQKSPGAILGRPTMARITEDNQFYVEGRLYKGLEDAQKLYQLAEVLENEDPDRRLGFSIEGQATQRDPLNKKKVLKARITGVAITHCPKNPNTLLSIMKGEYAEPFIETEPVTDVELNIQQLCDEYLTRKVPYTEDSVRGFLAEKYSIDDVDDVLLKNMCKVLEKSMSTSNIPMPESVHGAPKHITEQNVIEDVSPLSKSQVYRIIFEEMTTKHEEADLIYDFINQTKETMKKANISRDTISKAQELLELASSTEVVEETILTKSIELEEEDIEFMSIGMLQKGMTQDRINIVFDSKGLDLDTYYSIVERVCEDFTPLLKSEESTINFNTDSIEELIKSQQETLSQSINMISETVNSHVDRRIESILDTNDRLVNLIKSQSEDFNKVVEELEGKLEKSESRIKKIEEEPIPPRSLTKSRHIERFEQDFGSTDDSMTLSLSKAEDREILSGKLFEEVEGLRSRGQDYRHLEKAITDLEITKSFPKSAIPILQKLGLKLTN